MIIDHLSALDRYPYGPAWHTAMTYVKNLAPTCADGRYDLDGKRIFALLSRYQTKPVCAGRLESHRRYTDIQVLLAGRERVDWCPLTGLAAETPYDKTRDVGFWAPPAKGVSRLILRPGLFAVFFPRDAHAPQLWAGRRPEGVVKVVIKVAVDLLKV